MAISKDITVDQGADYVEHVQIKDGLGADINLVTGSYVSRLQVKRSYKNNAPIILDLTTANGKLVLHEGGDVGKVSIVLPPADTDALNIPGKVMDCVYDWELEDGAGFIRRLYEGEFVIVKNITT